jgi:hypothetical protein
MLNYRSLMASFDLSYDSEDDVLEITFAIFDENVARTVPLNDNIFVFSDLTLQHVWALTFYSFSKLFEVSETEFTALKDLTELQQTKVLSLLSREPASDFFDITYPEQLVARLRAPNLWTLIQSGSA